MRVELRRTADNQIETDWGIVEHPLPDPIPDQPGQYVVGHLLLLLASEVQKLANGEPQQIPEGIISTTVADSGTFLHLVLNNDQRYVWELHPAYWSNAQIGPDEWLCGIWRD